MKLMSGAQTQEMTLGFIGLGNMGLPIATNLLKAGYQLRVYNRTTQKAGPLVEAGAKLVSSPAETIEPGGIVFTMLADDAAVESVALSDSNFIGPVWRQWNSRLHEHDWPRDGARPGRASC